MSRERAAAVIERLVEIGGDALRETQVCLGDASAVVEPTRLRWLMKRVREDEALAFDMLVDATAVDYPESDPRFAVVYHLYSVRAHHRLRLKVHVPEAPCMVDSVAEIWPAADWLEREIFDLYGIVFRDHPGLERILLDAEFEGHPLRKDFPKRGHELPAVPDGLAEKPR